MLAVARTNVETGNGAGTDVGFLWSPKEFTRTGRSSAGGTLHVLLGVWGTWETPRTYYLDSLRVRIMPQ